MNQIADFLDAVSSTLPPTSTCSSGWRPSDVYWPIQVEEETNPFITPELLRLAWPPRLALGEELDSMVYTPAFRKAFALERRWRRLDELVVLSRPQIESLGYGAHCPVCDKRQNWVRYQGGDTLIVVSLEVYCDHLRHQRAAKLSRNRAYAAARAI